jgi:hypothetical protein
MLDPCLTARPGSDAQARRRCFSAASRLRIVTEHDALTEAGAKGALLRREGLYSCHVIEWRHARDAGALRPWTANAAVTRRP